MAGGDNRLGPIIAPQYDPNSGFREMVQDARGAAAKVRGEFDKSFEGIGRTVQKSLGGGIGNFMADELGKLHSQLDPLYTAQKRFNEEMDRADALLRAGVIGQRQYAQATQASRDALQQANAAIHGGAEATRIGTTANHMMVNSSRSLRQATLQSGQQLQDLAISLYSGQRASVVFAQQIPQLAFALTGLEGSANKTHDRIGRFATFLSGPWGLAVGLGIGVLAELAVSLLKSGDAADKSGSATSRLKDKLDLTRNSYSSLIAVVEEYNQKQDLSTSKTYDAIIAAEKEADRLLKVAKTRLALLKIPDGTAGSGLDAGAGAATGTAILYRSLQSQIETLEQQLADAGIAGSTERTKIATDPRYALEVKYNQQLLEQQALLKRGQIDRGVLDREELRITNAKIAALKAFDEANRKTGGRLGERETSAFMLGAAGRITSEPGFRTDPITGRRKYHAGLDIAAPHGSAVRAPAAGTVIETGTLPGYGKVVFIDHGAGTVTRLAHLSNNRQVREGDFVDQGQIVGNVGSTGRSTGPHLHQETRVNGKVVDPRRGALPVDFGDQARASEAAAERSSDALKRLNEFGREAAVSIGALRDRFNEVPQAVIASRAAIEQIDDLIGQLNDKQPTGFKDMVAQLDALRPAAQALADGPFNAMLRSAEEQSAVTRLLIQSKSVEAEVMQRQLQIERDQGPLSAEKKAALRDMVVALREQVREQERVNELRQRELALIGATEDNVRQTTYNLLKGGGFGALVDGLSRQWDLVLQNMADSIVDDVFGGFFKDQEDRARERMFPGVKDASLEVASAADAAADALRGLAATVPGSLESEFDAWFGAGKGKPANDNAPAVTIGNLDDLGNIITVNGRRQTRLALNEALTGTLQAIIGPTLTKKLGDAGPMLLKGAAFGQLGGGLVGRTNLGSVAGGIGGQAIVDSFSKDFTKTTLGKVLGSAIPIVGGILGGLVGGLFSKAKTGSASVSSGAVSLGGNNAEARNSVSGLAGNVTSSLDRIAEALGGTIGSYGYTIGQRKDEFRVSGSAGADVTGKKPKGDIIYRGKDAGEATRAALINAIEDGAVKGIREGSRRLLLAGQDLEAQLNKALRFQNVFDELKQRKDPLGYEIEKLNKEFSGLIGIFKEAGATTQEYAELEELYGLKRAEIVKQQGEAMRQANERVQQSLRGLIDDLETGDNGLSLRKRLSSARLSFDPLADAIRAGGTVDYDKFSEAARKVIELSRQIYGSQEAYFDVFNDVLALSKQALAKESNVTTITDPGLPSPFGPQASNDNTPVVGAINEQTAELAALLAASNQNLGTIIALLAANGVQTGTTYPYAGAGNF